jgi:hypothetical protein
MLVRVQQTMGVPYLLHSCGDHSGPELADDFEKGYGSDLVEVMDTRLLWKQRHKSILPPLGNVVVPPHEGGEIEDYL